MAKIVISSMGRKGVNVDKSPTELDPDELVQAQNAISEVLGAKAGLTNRPGLDEFTTDSGMGPVMGGIGVLEASGASGSVALYLGRGGAV